MAQILSFSQTIPQKFFDALIYDKPEIADYINPIETSQSQRLGISYIGVRNKPIVGYEIPGEIKKGIQNGKYKYEISEKSVEDSYIEVTFRVPEVNFSRMYYFNEGFVSNSAYISRNWKKSESRYFSFRLQEPKYFNDYCIKRLDDFVDMVADTLGFTISERRILEEQKIGYIFCESEKEVEEITGFKARGMAMLGSDEVVTSYQTHFHEVAHILINYKLKKPGLYTLPFFMEGFAVAVGGRGGMAPRVVTDLGFYLQKTGFLTYDSIITNEQFYSQDANMTYAVSGLYNSFLLSELGGENYLELYMKVNGDISYVKSITSAQIGSPENYKFNNFLETYDQQKDIKINEKASYDIQVIMPDICYEDIGNELYFLVNKNFSSFSDSQQLLNSEYESRMFNEINKQGYKNQKYMIVVDEKYVGIYNCFNDILLAVYDANFSIPSDPVSVVTCRPSKNKFFCFFVKKSIFDEIDFDEAYKLNK